MELFQEMKVSTTDGERDEMMLIDDHCVGRNGKKDELPWIEKYRPNLLSDIVGNSEIVSRLKDFVSSGNMPHLLFSGPPGIGKTTCILCLAHEMLGIHYHTAVLELNASNERGIEVVRGKIKSFAQRKVTLPPRAHKIIILDEADSMTEAAQQALRRTMEVYATTTRFALACNNSEKIIEAIQSRCAIIRFGRLPDDSIIKRIEQIAFAENLKYTQSGLKAIAFSAEGDLRKAVNNLQATAFGFNFIDEDNVFKVCDEPNPVMAKEILSRCLEQELDKAIEIGDYMWKRGYTAQDILSTLIRVLKVFDFSQYKKTDEEAEMLRIEMIKEVCLLNIDVAKLGIGSWLQIMALLGKFCLMSNIDKKISTL
ncbi:hypothetical protein ACOME3_005614 [Neoechinorhynchus agilis]